MDNLLNNISGLVSNNELEKKINNVSSLHPIIEITGGCNAKCPFCPTHSLYGNRIKFIEPEYFEKILKHIKAQGLIKDGQVLQLYDYGEPFIHPKLNEIIEIAAVNGHKVGFSSNFIILPNIKQENYKYIDFVVFSLCSLSNEYYKQIYGGDIDKVLNNFNTFLENKSLYNNNISILINWLKYKSNNNKDIEAKRYFEERGCIFRPITAFLNNRDDMIKLISDKMSYEEIDKINMFLDIKPCLHKIEKLKEDVSYECPQILKTLVVNESGELLGCCIDSSKENNLGKILNMDRKEILVKKLKRSSSKECERCSKLGIAKFIHSGLID